MALFITDIKQPVTEPEELLRRRIADKLGVDPAGIQTLRILRQALDARRKSDIHFLISALVELPIKDEKRCLSKGEAWIHPYAPQQSVPLVLGEQPCPGRILVVGLGPAGLFCGLTLAQYGYRPLIVERGQPVDARVLDVERFFSTGKLHTDSNVMFGAGGAGTFSDGKLTSRSKDQRGALVLDTLRRFGAPETVLTDAKPHIGTDRLRDVVRAMSEEIARLGGEVRYGTALRGISTAHGRVNMITLEAGGTLETVPCGAVALAIGQGARDTYRMLYNSGVAMAKKPFAVGVRIEHPQRLIDEAQFGALAGHPRLGAAEYRLTGKSGERGVYTFCMCPGGQVIASSSAEGEVVVNGMSNLARDGVNANAAVVVQINDTDTPNHPLAGLNFIEQMEQAAFIAGGGDYTAPASRVAEYLSGKASGPFGTVRPSYRPGVKGVALHRALPDFVARGLRDGIEGFGRQLKGFDMGDAVLTGVETRTSAPLRILRDETMESPSHRGLYPIGEGAGYAGGIVSAAIDGLKAAERIIGLFRPE